jgi:D-glycero-D-manno-heptose 1,7-bisphosphate phosphatase
LAAAWPIDADLIWAEVRRPRDRVPRPALFLDRDGVIVEEVTDLHRVEDTVVIQAALPVIAAANARDIPVVVVTNQGGIGRGLFGWPEFAAVQAEIERVLAAGGARLDAVYACPFHERGGQPHGHPDHPDRKPNHGMLLKAARALNLDLGRSWIAGDSTRDIVAAERAGLAGALHVLTGHGPRHRGEVARLEPRPGFALHLVDSIEAAGGLIPFLR